VEPLRGLESQVRDQFNIGGTAPRFGIIAVRFGYKW
jgi:hypothetical protein